MKNIANLAVQIILVVAAVLVFSFFDPFGLLMPKKKTLHDTPISVVSIKEIGQLITAEYYGEVLSSLHEEMIEELQANQDTFNIQVGKLNQKYVKALANFSAGKDTVKLRWYRKRKDLVEVFYNSNSVLVNDVFYQNMISIVLKANNLDSEGDLLKSIWMEKGKIDLAKYRFDINTLEAEKIAELDKLKNSKAFRKKQIIAIGRGWVKAGIDFGNFTEQNFKYDKNNRIIYLFGLETKILNADINPWFNAKQKIKGFEIIAATNRANDSSYLRKIKGSCLEKLKAQADKAGIMIQAKANAEETLKNFFSLMLSEPLDKVVIMKNSLAEYQAFLDYNEFYPKERLGLIDSSLLALDKIDPVAAGEIVTRLLGAKTIMGNDTFLINRHTALTHQVIEDKLINPDEWKILGKAFRDTTYTRLDSIWYLPLPVKKQLTKRAKMWASSNPVYDTDGIGYWYDSVTNNKSYLYYRTRLDSMRKVLIQHEYRMNRALALDASIHLLKKKCKTLIVDTKEESDQKTIEILLNTISK